MAVVAYALHTRLDPCAQCEVDLQKANNRG
jgi:hypothetical protein